VTVIGCVVPVVKVAQALVNKSASKANALGMKSPRFVTKCYWKHNIILLEKNNSKTTQKAQICYRRPQI